MKLNLHPKLEVGGLEKKKTTKKPKHNRMNKSLNRTNGSLVGAGEAVWAPK